MAPVNQGKSWRWQFVLAALLVGALSALTLAWQAASEAGAPPFEPRLLAAFRDRQLLLSVGLPVPAKKTVDDKVYIELVDAAGQAVDHRESKFDTGVSLAFAFDNVKKADADKLRLRVTYKDKKFETPLSKVLLGKGHETLISAGTEFHAGSQAALTCIVQGVRTIAETAPHIGADVAIALLDAKQVKHPLFTGVTDSDGKLSAAFEIPALEAGPYTMQITTRSPLGQEKLRRPVKINADGKILLVSDRPIYQPGHVIHLRALALHSFDMKPLDNRDLLFEVEDPKGNKVLKRTFKTSEFGIASVDFQLADEVNLGDYHLRAVSDGLRAEKTVQVKRYVLPKFKVEVKADKTFYLPKETVKIDLQSDYFFGKPVANSKIEVTASTFDVAFKEFAGRGRPTPTAMRSSRFSFPTTSSANRCRRGTPSSSSK